MSAENVNQEYHQDHERIVINKMDGYGWSEYACKFWRQSILY